MMAWPFSKCLIPCPARPSETTTSLTTSKSFQHWQPWRPPMPSFANGWAKSTPASRLNWRGPENTHSRSPWTSFQSVTSSTAQRAHLSMAQISMLKMTHQDAISRQLLHILGMAIPAIMNMVIPAIVKMGQGHKLSLPHPWLHARLPKLKPFPMLTACWWPRRQ